MKCCICGHEIEEKHLNDPYGSLDKEGEVIPWMDDDWCCDACNERYVIPGRLAQMYGTTKEQIKRIMPDNLV